MSKANPLSRQLIKVGGLKVGLAIATQVAVAKAMELDENDARAARIGRVDGGVGKDGSEIGARSADKCKQQDPNDQDASQSARR
jgi:hypothetical protein